MTMCLSVNKHLWYVVLAVTIFVTVNENPQALDIKTYRNCQYGVGPVQMVLLRFLTLTTPHALDIKTYRNCQDGVGPVHMVLLRFLTLTTPHALDIKTYRNCQY